VAYRANNSAELKKLLHQYGVEFFNQLGETPLQGAVRMANIEAISWLADLGADRLNPGKSGKIPFALALSLLPENDKKIQKNISSIIEHTAPSSINIRFMSKMKKLDQHQVEYILLFFIFAQWRSLAAKNLVYHRIPHFNAAQFQMFLQYLPSSLVPPFRKKKPYISSVLAKNEIQRQTGQNRNLLYRVQRGAYMVNPLLEIQCGTSWYNVNDLAGVDVILGTINSEIKTWYNNYMHKLKKKHTRYF